jgi:hypothetical protein
VSRYTDTGGFGWAHEQRFGWRPWQEWAWKDRQRFVAPASERDEWVSINDTLWQHRVNHNFYEWDGRLEPG